MRRILRRWWYLMLLTAPLAMTSSIPACSDSTGACCRTCTTGKACGDSCIARDETCHVGPGCACNG